MASDSIVDDFLQSLLREDIGVLSVEEEHHLSKQIQAGDQAALDRLIKHNLRFAVFLVTKMTAWNFDSTPREDLISMANEQLVIAARRWIPNSKSARFSSYAKNFILRGVQRELDNNTNIIRIPINIMEAIKKLYYIERELANTHNRKPRICEIAEVMGLSEDKIRQLQAYIIREPISLDTLDEQNSMEDDE